MNCRNHVVLGSRCVRVRNTSIGHKKHKKAQKDMGVTHHAGILPEHVGWHKIINSSRRGAEDAE
jgi:hypothetical protein